MENIDFMLKAMNEMLEKAKAKAEALKNKPVDKIPFEIKTSDKFPQYAWDGISDELYNIIGYRINSGLNFASEDYEVLKGRIN